MEEEDDRDDESLFDQLSESFRETLAMIEKKVKEKGTSLEETGNNLPYERNEPFSDSLNAQANKLSVEIAAWLTEASESGMCRPDLLRRKPYQSDHRVEALDIILWYNHFIPVNLEHATRIGNNPEETEALPGLIFRPEMTAMKGLEKSIRAWTVIMEESPEYEDRILDFLVRLVRISNIAKERFPGAKPLSGQSGVNEAEASS